MRRLRRLSWIKNTGEVREYGTPDLSVWAFIRRGPGGWLWRVRVGDLGAGGATRSLAAAKAEARRVLTSAHASLCAMERAR